MSSPIGIWVLPNALFRPTFKKSNRYTPLQPRVPTARSNGNTNRTIGLPPSLILNVPDRQVVPRKRDSDALCLTRCYINVRKSPQNRRGLSSRSGVVEVQLRDLPTRDMAGILNGEGCLVRWPVEPVVPVASSHHLFVWEGRI